MTASTSLAQSVTADELAVLMEVLGVHSLPAVLTVLSGHATIDAREAARAQARANLAARGLFVGDEVDPELAAIIGALHRPDREMAARLVAPSGIVRICAVRRGSLCALARSTGQEVSLRFLGYGGAWRNIVDAMVAELPAGPPAAVDPLGAPLSAMTESLFGTRDALALTDRIRAMGAPPRAAGLLGAALGSRQAFAEIVYAALIDGEDRISRAPAAVAMFYTARGRVVGAPSVSPSGQLWTTLKAGSDHALVQAINQLVELCDDRWGINSEA